MGKKPGRWAAASNAVNVKGISNSYRVAQECGTAKEQAQLKRPLLAKYIHIHIKVYVCVLYRTEAGNERRMLN